MDKKIKLALIIFGCTVFLLIVVLIISTVLRDEKNQSVAPANEVSQTKPQVENDQKDFNDLLSDKVIVATPQGNVDLGYLPQRAEKIISSNNLLIKHSADYDILFFYDNGKNNFLITLNNANVQEARNKAEVDFLQILGIDKKQACLLSVELRIPFDVSERLAGQNFGLSFCPNGKAFN